VLVVVPDTSVKYHLLNFNVRDIAISLTGSNVKFEFSFLLKLGLPELKDQVCKATGLRV
jgi:hypothetical protein